MSQKSESKQRKPIKGLKAVASTLFSDKWALSKAVLITLVDSVFAALLPFGTKMLLDNPSIWTATWATLFTAAQVFCFVVRFDMIDTLEAAMEKDQNSRVFLQMVPMSKQYLKRTHAKHGQMHSSFTANLVKNFGTNLLKGFSSVTVVLSQLVGIALAFGIGIFFWLTLAGLVSMAGLVYFAYRWNKRLSLKRKKLIARQNNHLEQFADQLEVHQSAGTSWVKFRLFQKVLDEKIQLYRKLEWKRAVLVGAPRILPQLVVTWLIYVVAISENRPPAELAMLSGYVVTTMMVSSHGFELLLNIAENQGDIYHLDELLSSSDIRENNLPRGDRPQGEHVIDRTATLSIGADLRVKLSNGDVLFPNGLFPRHPHLTELIIRKGDCIVCVGAKGSGKSTLADILGRYSENLSTDSVRWAGMYRVNEQNVFDTTLESFYFRVFYGPQTANQVDGIREDKKGEIVPGTVRDNIGLFLHHPRLSLHLTSEEKEMWVKRAAAVVTLDGKLDQEVSTLSGGERALCMLGRGILQLILGELDVLILDEPFAHLDVDSGQEMAKMLSYLAKVYQCALFIINHVDSLNPPDATAYVFGESGEGIVEIGKVKELRKNMNSKYYQILMKKPDNTSAESRWEDILDKTTLDSMSQ